MSKQEIADWANSLPPGEIDLDENPMIQKLTWLMQQAGYTADQI